MQPYENAKQICLSQEVGDPSLIQINSFEEQRFIEKLLFDDNKIVEFVWLGARLDTKTHKFHWEGKTEPITNYEHWVKLKNNTDYECVEMIPDGNEKGKWINTSCKKKNLIVCQKMQGWGLFGIFVVDCQHYGCTIGFTFTQILGLIMNFSYLIRFSLSGSFLAALTLVFLMELIIVILCILYAIKLKNYNKIFLCIKSVLLTWFSISSISAAVLLILVYTFLIISIFQHLIDVSWFLAAVSIGLFILILILIGGIMVIHRQHFGGCIIFTICYTIYSILNLIYLYYDQYYYFEFIQKIIIISMQITFIVLWISYTYLIRKT